MNSSSGSGEAPRSSQNAENSRHDEHDPMAALQQQPPDPDAVVRRAERALGEEDDVAAQASACSRSAQSSSGSSSPTLSRSSPAGTRSPSQRERLSSSDSVPP